MTITLADLKWKKSERLTDNEDGGGRMTGTAIVDGVVGNLFPNISRIDRAGGKVNLRKAFPHVATNNTDTAGGAGAIVVAPPSDPRVSIVMFSTGSDFDERADARDYVESYVVKGPVSPFRLYDTQQLGQRMLLMFATTTTASPEVGEVYCLSVEASGYPAHEFYVRIEEISFVDTEFEYSGGDKKTWRIYTLRINKPLDQAYPGEDPQSDKNPVLSAAKTKMRRTQVAAAARYYGISKLAESAVPGDNLITVDSIYGQLVPASTDPQGLVNQLPGGTISAQIASGAALTVTINAGTQTSAAKPLYLGSGILPGSLIVVSSSESVTYTDASGALISDTPTGRCIGSEVSYADGAITLNGNAYGGTYTITFVPAATVLQSPRSQLQTIELETQRYVYTFNLRPYPAPGSVVISYRALGKWYVVRDDGAGHLVPDIPGTGSGLIDYNSGNANVTFSALPDVDSAVLVNWGETEIYEILAGDVTVDLPLFVVNAPVDETSGKRKAIDPDSVSITWTNSGSKSASDNSVGTISGDATGIVYYADGIIKFRPNSLPVSGTIYTVSMTCGAVHDGDVTGTISDTTISGTLGPAPIRANSVRLEIACDAIEALPAGYWFATGSVAGGTAYTLVVTDDGSGNLVDEDGETVGTINLTTGEWSVDTASSRNYKVQYGG